MRSITIETTTACQANCVMCVRDKIGFTIGNMNMQVFQHCMEEAVGYYKGNNTPLDFIDFGGMGEPLLDVGFEEKCLWMKEKNSQIRIAVTTNGGEIIKNLDALCNLVNVLKISHYGYTKEVFEKTHRGNLSYEKVKSGIEALLCRKKRPYVVMSYCCVTENISEMDSWKEYWEDKCDEISIWKPHNWAGKLHDSVKNGNPRTCGRLDNDFVIRCNGDVSACCFDFNRELVVGNILQSSFSEIVNSEKFKKLLSIHKDCEFNGCGLLCENCDQIYDRSEALIYSSLKDFKVGMKATSKDILY